MVRKLRSLPLGGLASICSQIKLVIPRELRGGGIGSAVLCAVEQLAQSEGFERVRVWPRLLDGSLDQWRLERWYCERGYEIVTDGTGDMEKRISL
jgi:GNAT superfamily N-acetyltransferase